MNWRIISSGLLLVYLAGLLIGTHIPQQQLPAIGKSDKLLHLLAYGGLGFLAALRLASSRHMNWRHSMLWLIGLSVLAAGDELTQPLVNRHADVADWIADLFGLFLGFALFFVIHRIRRWLRKS